MSPSSDPHHTAAGRALDGACLETHYDHLHGTARRLCASPADAEDLAQAVCVRVLERARDVQVENPQAYLATMVRHAWIARHRTAEARRTVPTAPEDLDPLAGHTVGPERALEAREACAAIRALPPAQRRVVAAVDLQGLSYAETAHALAIPAGTVMSRLSRGRASLAGGLRAAA